MSDSSTHQPIREELAEINEAFNKVYQANRRLIAEREQLDELVHEYQGLVRRILDLPFGRRILTFLCRE